MLYKFRDVNEELTQEYIPAEALQINGELIETQIEGYHTLYVQGREALSPEINTYEIGTKNGEIRKNKRYPARTITVGYQLIAESADDYDYSLDDKMVEKSSEFAVHLIHALHHFQ